MTKKDRIAVVISVLYFLFPLIALVSGFPKDFLGFTAPLVIYWGYRFVKGDISFLKMKNLD